MPQEQCSDGGSKQGHAATCCRIGDGSGLISTGTSSTRQAGGQSRVETGQEALSTGRMPTVTFRASCGLPRNPQNLAQGYVSQKTATEQGVD